MDCGPLVLCVEWLLLFGLCVCVLVRGVVPVGRALALSTPEIP